MSAEYETAHTSVTRQLLLQVQSNWLDSFPDFRERLAAQDITLGDAGALLKAIERGQITQERVLHLAFEAEGLGLIPNSRVEILKTRIS